MIDLHMHTFFSDGVLSPSELVYRYKHRGAAAVALTDHADYSNMEFIITSIRKATASLKKFYELEVLAGVELTYIPPDDMHNMVAKARKTGAEIVVVHGESPVEVVPAGTNMAAVRAGCDILAHPGHITDETARIAAEKGVFLELTTRNGHRDTNKEVYEAAVRNAAGLVLNTDSHAPSDLLDEEKVMSVLEQCGAGAEYRSILTENSKKLLKKISERKND
ncbi:MAG: histidinol phosphate phosphatase domain-containing protein [Elusimicrobia bacterium]|nr:histidinol phosphate phosphatase domain-containing protein [Elusimicrobiota bacterium]